MSEKKNHHAVSLGRKGGQARAATLTPEQRSAAAKKAVEARIAKLGQARKPSPTSK